MPGLALLLGQWSAAEWPPGPARLPAKPEAGTLGLEWTRCHSLLLEKHIGPFVAASTSTSITVGDTVPQAGDIHEEVNSLFKVKKYTALHSKGSR